MGRTSSAYDWAMAYSGLENKQQTLMWLQTAYEERNGRMGDLGVHPQFAFCAKSRRFNNSSPTGRPRRPRRPSKIFATLWLHGLYSPYELLDGIGSLE